MYDNLVIALKASGIPFAEYAWDIRPKVNYGVVAIDGAGRHAAADNHVEHQAVEGTVDLFTYTNDRQDVDTIQQVLNDFDGLTWYLESVQYESDPRLIHWEWVFQLEAF